MKYENMQHIWLKPGPLVRAVKGFFKQPTCLGSKNESFQHFKVEIINLNQYRGQTGKICCSGTWKKTARGHDYFTAYLNSSVQLDLQDGLGNISPLTLFNLG